MNIAIPDRYLLADDFEQRAVGVNFPAEVWNVAAELAEVREPTSPFELEALTGHPLNQVREALERLLAKKLVTQNLMTWKEYPAIRKQTAGTTTRSQPNVTVTAAIAAAAAAAAPEKPTIPALTVSAKPQAGSTATPVARNGNTPAKEGVALRLGSISPQPKPAASATTAWGWQKPDSARVAASKPGITTSLPDGEQPDGRLLRPLLAQIENIKGGGVEGQLLVYQVFLRVPYQLLYDEGIKSLHFVDERTVIKNPALHAAIVKAAKDVAGIDLT